MPDSPSTRQQILDAFERLSLTDKRIVATEIIRYAMNLNSPVLTDEELALTAEGLFFEIDKQEATDVL